MESKIPNVKAKVIIKDLSDHKDNKNAYVLLKDAEQATMAASKLNQTVFMEKHIRVDIDSKDKGKSTNDFETTIFVGNLPFIVNEEDVRAHFITEFKQEEDVIQNVRLIRDP